MPEVNRLLAKLWKLRNDPVTDPLTADKICGRLTTLLALRGRLEARRALADLETPGVLFRRPDWRLIRACLLEVTGTIGGPLRDLDA